VKREGREKDKGGSRTRLEALEGGQKRNASDGSPMWGQDIIKASPTRKARLEAQSAGGKKRGGGKKKKKGGTDAAREFEIASLKIMDHPHPDLHKMTYRPIAIELEEGSSEIGRENVENHVQRKLFHCLFGI